MSRAIYVPKGRAGEYADLAFNLYAGCSHGCTYCYAPGVVHRERKDFNKKVTVRKDILDNLRKDAPEYAGKKIFMCFTCDPYTAVDGVPGPVTREAIEILKDAGCGVEVLSKAGRVCAKDFDLLASTAVPSAFGTTLTTLDVLKADEFEPKAASPADRCKALVAAKVQGIETFVSLEPVIWPEDTLEIICKIHRYVDRFKIGRWNHDERANEIPYRKFAQDAIDLCEKLGIDYMLKKDLTAFLED